MEIVAGFGCSHAGLMITRRDQASADSRAIVYSAFRQMGAAIEAAGADAVAIIGTDHGRVYSFAHVSAYTIGVNDCAAGIGDAGLPRREVPIKADFARSILTGAIEEGIDLAYSEAMSIDHSFITPLMLSEMPSGMPIVPIATNCNAPPLPTLRRSYEVGRKLGNAIRSGPAGKIAVLATGGLSHWVGPPTFQGYLRETPGTRIGREADHPMLLDDTGPVNLEFDREFLDAICSGHVETFIDAWGEARIYDEAGNGAQEIRNWIVAAGILENARATVLGYAPEEAWLTGTAVVQFSL